jgi:acyl-CoA thioesterase
LALNGADGRYRLEPDATLEGQPGNIFGGVLLGIVMRAAGLAASATRPASAAVQFLRPATMSEPLDIEALSLKRGRSSELLAVSVTQAGKTVAEAQIRATDEGEGPICAPSETPPPELGDPFSLPDMWEIQSGDGRKPPGISAHWEDRTDDFEPGQRHGSFWNQLRPAVTFADPFLEAARYTLALDSGGGAVLNLLSTEVYGRSESPWGFSNLDALIHFHQPRGTEWIYTTTRVVTGSDGLASTQTQNWSSDGNLLATNMSQIAFFPLPPGWSAVRDT